MHADIVAAPPAPAKPDILASRARAAHDATMQSDSLQVRPTWRGLLTFIIASIFIGCGAGCWFNDKPPPITGGAGLGAIADPAADPATATDIGALLGAAAGGLAAPVVVPDTEPRPWRTGILNRVRSGGNLPAVPDPPTIDPLQTVPDPVVIED